MVNTDFITITLWFSEPNSICLMLYHCLHWALRTMSSELNNYIKHADYHKTLTYKIYPHTFIFYNLKSMFFSIFTKQ